MRGLALVCFAVAIGCSSSGDDGPSVDASSADTAVVVDTGTPDTSSEMDSATDAAETTATSGTTGKPCTTIDDCDLLGDGVNQCSNNWFSYGWLLPDPVCFGTTCTAAETGKLASCDQNKGWCIGTTNTRCYPKCSFEADSEAAPAGCVGKDACHWVGSTTDDKGTKHGAGYCFGGCTSDADCPSSHLCQVEWGDCVMKAKHWVAAKNVGDPCVPADGDSTPPKCDCYYNSTVGKGYCTQFCKMGDSPSTCPTGFTCDAQLPNSGTGLVFTAAPKGLAGACLKNCDTDAECAPLGGFCDQRAGTGRKTCQFGVRSGTTDAGSSDAAGD